MNKDPLKAIRAYKEQGYRIELQVDSVRDSYTIHVVDQKTFRKFQIPLKDIPIQKLHDALRGL